MRKPVVLSGWKGGAMTSSSSLAFGSEGLSGGGSEVMCAHGRRQGRGVEHSGWGGAEHSGRGGAARSSRGGAARSSRDGGGEETAQIEVEVG
jgi:hypothetical protein